MREIRSAVITGPTGAIGQALCRLLLSNNIKVFAVCRPNSKRAHRLPNHTALNIISCDITELDSLPQKLNESRIDAFFHLAWAGNDGNNRNNMRIQTANIGYTLDACHTAYELGCRVFIGAGSQAEYGRSDKPLAPDTPCFPETGYGMAKLCAGQMSREECKGLGIDHIWTRIFSVYGPFEQASSMTISTIKQLLCNKVPAMTSGEQVWDYLYSDDAASALYNLALSGMSGAVYTLGSGNAQPLRKYVEIMRDAVDPSISIDFGAIPYGEKQIMNLQADISTLTADIGFKPKTDFKEGIRHTVEWVRRSEDE